MPARFQMSRQHPWARDNPEAVIVDRRTRWGNPYRVGDITPVWRDRYGWGFVHTRASAVEAFADYAQSRGAPYTRALVAELAGRDLACWCPLDQPCHGDVLLQIANRTGGEGR
ncbi:DUF4326 domain-containing protein [Cellulomonas triticagri]|uniref:DUF4326 domain-containing protein n=1 Tax=Cellulomonas triticagri TaxID=2483352 RepID=A0A3M2JEK0_9CELL|nr:DUF4326 domain-containing protein [Cellulomonas triticagri]RMI09385.1 DUF4326 domain-containing protein [Cellulomonas triticagri]